MTPAETTERRPRHVFISYSSEDKNFASQLASALQNAGIGVWLDAWEIAPGDSIVARIEGAVSANDVLLVLLSRRSVDSPWVKNELGAILSRELSDRAITVIPVVIEDCEVPQSLSSRLYLDLRHDFADGAQHLINQLAAVPHINFSDLDPLAFENLVGDLLTEVGFSVQRSPATRDRGFDFIASCSFRDPFGAEKTESWLVEVKLYRDQRTSVSALRQMLGSLMTSRGPKKGLVVTNGKMTSVAREFLSEVEQKSGCELRVIDGSELVGLLLQQPKIVRRYFGHGRRK